MSIPLQDLLHYMYLGPLGANGSNTAVQYSGSVVSSSGSLRQYGMSSILTGWLGGDTGH